MLCLFGRVPWLLQLLTDNILSPASDVFSFGIVMYELLTFKVPFEGLRKEQVRESLGLSCSQFPKAHTWRQLGATLDGRFGGVEFADTHANQATARTKSTCATISAHNWAESCAARLSTSDVQSQTFYSTEVRSKAPAGGESNSECPLI